MMGFSGIGVRHALAFVLVLVAARRASGQSACAAPPDAIATIDRADADWLPAMRAHDAARIVAPYDSAAVFVTADGASIVRRDRIAAMYRTRFKRIARVIDGAIVRDGACAAGDSLVNEWGHGGLSFTDSAGTTHHSVGPYLTVWKHKPGGAWLIIRNLVF
jgi:ketosteroid isomerase-like protein